MKWLIAFLIFSLLILFHEFGHFIVAKLNGVDVEEFSMGFGPRLLSGTFRGTRYSLKLLLFGGSCQMKGMYDLDEEEEDGPPKEPEKGSFQSVSLGRRAAIIFAGPFFNFLLSFICAIIILSVVGYDPAVVSSVTQGSPAAEAGLKAGDEIVSFMGDHVTIGRDVEAWFTFNDLKEGETVTLKVKRDGQTVDIQYTPAVQTRYMMGISYMADDNPCKLSAVSENSPVYAAGLRAGDTITAIDGTPIKAGKDLNAYFTGHPMDGSEVTLKYTRNGQGELSLTFRPYESRQVQLGFQYNLARVKTDALGVLRYGFTEIRYWIVTTLRSIASLFTGRFTVNDLSGPVGIVDIVGTTYESVKSEGTLMTWLNMLNLIVLLSANLGVINLLPIPALDGGRLLFFLVEAIIRRPINKKVEIGIQVVAVALLAVLAVYVLFHDITRIIGR